MAGNTTGNPELDELVSQLDALGKHQYAQVLSAASKNRGEKSRSVVAKIVNEDIQENLAAAGFEPTCPECGSAERVRRGKRNGLQTYQCRLCGRRYTATSGTFLEKSGYMWDVWVKVVSDLASSDGIGRTVNRLRDDYGCSRIHPETVWNMRMKVLYAIWTLPSPTLRGTIQMDDTFFREAQKGADELVNPLPKSANVERKPRHGLSPSLLGVLGPEFASVTCAVDGTGHCVIRSLSMGAPTERQVRGFIGEHMADVAFLATDDDTTYRKAIRELSLPHYIRPSSHLAQIKAAGHEQLSKDPERAEAQAEANRRIYERLWRNGELDRIEGVEASTYNQHLQLVRTYGLNLSAVNSLHGRLDDFIKRDRRNVSTNYLPLYLAFFEYLENRRADGRGTDSLSDAADILAEAVATRAVFSPDVAAEWAAGGFAPDTASGRFVAKLIDGTSAVRIATGNPDFKFRKSDGFRYVSTRDLLLGLSLTTLKAMAKEGKVKIGSKSKSSIVKSLLELDEIEEMAARYAYADAADRVDDEDRSARSSATYAGADSSRMENRVVLSATMPAMMFAAADEAESPVVFLTVKTTGTDYDADEVVAVAILSEDGEVLMDGKFRPRHKENWYAKRSNPCHVRPADVVGVDGVKHISEAAGSIEGILREAGSVVGWNIHFQLDMLHACHVNVPVARKYIDMSPALYKDSRKRNKNRRNAFDAKAQEKFEYAVRDLLGEDYDAESAFDDAVYLMRLWATVRQGTV